MKTFTRLLLGAGVSPLPSPVPLQVPWSGIDVTVNVNSLRWSVAGFQGCDPCTAGQESIYRVPVRYCAYHPEMWLIHVSFQCGGGYLRVHEKSAYPTCAGDIVDETSVEATKKLRAHWHSKS